MKKVRLDRYTLIADEITDSDNPNNGLLGEFAQLHDVSGRSKSAELWQTARELSKFFIIVFEIVLIGACLIAFLSQMWSHTFNGENDEFFLYVAVTILFVGLVSFLGQLEFDPDSDTKLSGRLTLIISLLIACMMICLLNYATNYSWFSLASMCRYVPILFALGTTYIFIFSSGWSWAHDVDYSFGIDICAFATFIIAAGLLGPYVLFGLLKLTCWWISKI